MPIRILLRAAPPFTVPAPVKFISGTQLANGHHDFVVSNMREYLAPSHLNVLAAPSILSSLITMLKDHGNDPTVQARGWRCWADSPRTCRTLCLW